MFYIRFIIGGLIIASVPVVANRLNAKTAGYVTLIPVIMFISFLTLYFSSGNHVTQKAAQAYLVGLPSVIVAAFLMVLLLKYSVNIYATVALSLLAWFVSILIINKLVY